MGWAGLGSLPCLISGSWTLLKEPFIAFPIQYWYWCSEIKQLNSNKKNWWLMCHRDKSSHRLYWRWLVSFMLRPLLSLKTTRTLLIRSGWIREIMWWWRWMEESVLFLLVYHGNQSSLGICYPGKITCRSPCSVPVIVAWFELKLEYVHKV